MDPDKKGAKMAGKTEAVRRAFNLPETESVVQDYVCTLKRGVVPAPGKLIVTQNYVLWRPRIGSAGECVPFRRVSAVRSVGSSSVALECCATASAAADVQPLLTFGALRHRDETFQLLRYLLRNPVSYVALDSAADASAAAAAPSPVAVTAAAAGGGSAGFDFERASASSGSSSSSRSGGGGGGTPSTTTTTATAAAPRRAWGIASTQASGGGGGGGGSSVSVGEGGQMEETRVRVDLQASRLALQRAEECRELGAATLTELSRQGEVLDDIEQHVENVHHSLDRSARHIRGVESIGGSLANKLAAPIKPGRQVERKDHAVVVERVERPVDIAVLYKHKDDSLSPATLRIGSVDISVLHEGAKESQQPERYPLVAIAALVLRARPQHIDVRFKPADGESGGGAKMPDRVRFLSSYLQLIVNELVLRCGPGCSVVFERNAKSFEYGKRELRRLLVGNAATSFSSGSSQQGHAPSPAGSSSKPAAPSAATASAASSFIASMPEEYRADLEQQERDLDLISGAVDDVHAMALAMRPVLAEQDTQLTRVTARVDEANQRIGSQQTRVQRLL